ncbi:hypothetical protein AB0K86_19650 [Streptomyces clavifer]|uniref:hypothetical protein n=1 Tax=Streptomyces TaxID=1883 RepID=UPI001F5BDF0E|nr:hypothetical protein [Streptomyces sp. Root55]
MAYSESLFVALAVWALLALLQNHWMTAGIISCFAGLTRPVGIAVSFAIFAVAITTLAKNGVESDKKTRLKIFASCIISPLGAAAYILWVGYQRGDLLGYLKVQEGWGNGFDGGIAFAKFISSSIHESNALAALFLVAIILLCGWPYRVAWKQNQPLALFVYSVVITIMAMGASGYFGSKPRLLVPAFPLLLSLAIRMARARPIYVYVTLSVMIIGSAIYGAFWLNGTGPP